MKTGIVKSFDKAKGAGLITPDGGGKDLLVESTNVRPGLQLQAKQRVQYDEIAGPKGTQATNVALAAEVE